MRITKQRNTRLSRLIPVAALVLTALVLTNAVRLNADISGRAAVFSAALNMPDGGLKLLRERYRNELYGEEDANPQQTETPVPPQAAEDTADTPDTSASEGDVAHIPEDATAPNPVKPPKIPEKYKAELVSESFAGRESTSLITYGAGYIKNDTKKDDSKIEELLETGFDLGLTDTAEPQVLIFHTHATESFEKYDSNFYDTRNTWRSTDNNSNMVAVGSAMQQVLEENGIGVIHDSTQHDYPSYNGSYERSAKTIKEYLEEYPSIKIVLDVHRDAMERDNQVIVKPVTTINGKKAAQIMIVSGCDDGTMNMPDWPENLRFAAAFADRMQQSYPDLCRPVYLCYRKYNMDLSHGSLLLEFGSNANTLDEAVYSARLAGEALASLIKEHVNEYER